ncbi:MAG: DUF4397 domain-containing protein [Chitinophaga sp.]|uniref:DUF4397 domain-containing protein n=1 Tax=Chitinophaga sp. TaxID=1869181 RepID=UPI001B283935|nr:DUF4397 domain-containing protein [Chitinophaga sp.]MBO9728165.1 DUF4397 domain-containing protein [Chitinophaga sp.]
MLTKNNRVWAAAALLTAAIGFTSCLKNDKVTPSRPKAMVQILNASTNMVPASFYDNGQRISGDTANIGYGFYGFYPVLGGSHTFALKKRGGDSVITSNSSVYDSTSYYTYVVLGNNPVMSANVQSDFTSASPQKINIRCWNLSQGAGAGDLVDFYVGNEKIDSNRRSMSISEVAYSTKFAQFTNFSVNSAVTIKKAGTTEILATNNDLTRIDGRSLNAGSVYTIYFIGTKGSTGIDKPFVNVIPSLY